MMKPIKESNGSHNGETIFCPVNGWGCPYYEKGICYIADPMTDCVDFVNIFESWEEWEKL